MGCFCDLTNGRLQRCMAPRKNVVSAPSTQMPRQVFQLVTQNCKAPVLGNETGSRSLIESRQCKDAAKSNERQSLRTPCYFTSAHVVIFFYGCLVDNLLTASVYTTLFFFVAVNLSMTSVNTILLNFLYEIDDVSVQWLHFQRSQLGLVSCPSTGCHERLIGRYAFRPSTRVKCVRKKVRFEYDSAGHDFVFSDAFDV